MLKTVTVRVPATTANLGPGFDCLGMALDLWNETVLTVQEKGLDIVVRGEGEGRIPLNETNLIYQSFCHMLAFLKEDPPVGLRIACQNMIPLCSGLGSSSAAVVTGVLAANALLEDSLSSDGLIRLAAEIEGHPDNVAPAYWGGLTISTLKGDKVISRKVQLPQWQVIVVLPDVNLSTETARLALPEYVPMKDAVSNIGYTALLVEAFREGDFALLREVMQDRIHQTYRLPLIPGAVEAINSAQELGAAAALSGAGPSVVAFVEQDAQIISNSMKKAFLEKGVLSRCFILSPVEAGAKVLY